jgi:outer membrane protein assembly factor BamB
MFFVPFYPGTPHPASLAQLINLNQHILWHHSYTGTLRLAQISSRGETIAFVTDAQPSTLTVLDGSNGQQLWTFTPTGIAQYNRTIAALGVSADGEYLAIGTTGGSVYLFHRSSREIVQHWQTSIPISSVGVSEVGTFIAISFAGAVYFLSRLEGIPLWGEYFALPPFAILNMSIDREGSTLAVSTTENIINVIRTGDGELFWDSQLNATITTLQLNAAGTLLFTTTEDYGILFSESGARIQEYPIAPKFYAFSGAGQNVALTPNVTVYVYNLQSQRPIVTHTFDSQVSSLAFTFEGTFLLAGTLSGTLYTINPVDFDIYWTLSLGEPVIRLLTPDVGDYFLAATPTQIVTGRISSITGLFTYLGPLILVILTTVCVGIITIWLVRPRPPPKLLTTEKDE